MAVKPHLEYNELPLLLGKSLELGNRPAYLLPKQQNLSMQIMGLPGSGKSKFMENMIRQDILNNRGLCLIDPHGSLVHDVLMWLADNPWIVEEKNVVVLDPADKEFSFGFNPFVKEMDETEREYYVTSLVETVIGIWDDGDSFSKPLIKEALTALFYLLMVKKLSLSQAFLILDFEDTSEIRKEFIQNDVLDNPTAQHFFTKLSRYKRIQEFDGAFNGSDRRIAGLLFNSLLRRIFSSESHIEIGKLMDEGAIVLVDMNSKGRIGKDDGKIFAALLINEIYREGLKRKANKARSFSLYIDECHRYLRGDIESMLSELRKFHISVVLAHQWLTQIKDLELRNGIINGCQTKVIFRVGEYDDAFYWAKNLFLYDINTDDVVKQWTHEVIGHEVIELEGESEAAGIIVTDSKGLSQSVVETVTKGTSKTEAISKGSSQAKSLSESSGSSESDSWGEVVSFNSGISETTIVDTDSAVVIGLPTTITESSSDGSSSSYGGSSSYSESRSETESFSKSTVETIAEAVSEAIANARGETASRSSSLGKSNSQTKSKSQSLMPILRRVPKSFLSIDDQRHKRAEQILRLPMAYCIVQAGTEDAILLETVFTKSAVVRPERFDAFVRSLKEKSDELVLITEGERSITFHIAEIEEEERDYETVVTKEGNVND